MQGIEAKLVGEKGLEQDPAGQLPGLQYSYRFLQPEEFERLDPYFQAEGVPTPDPRFSKIIIAEDAGAIIGLICFQLVPHVEPIIVEEEYRSKGVASNLARLMDLFCLASAIPGVYAQPTVPAACHLLEAHGFEKCEHPFYIKIYYDPREVKEEEEDGISDTSGDRPGLEPV